MIAATICRVRLITFPNVSGELEVIESQHPKGCTRLLQNSIRETRVQDRPPHADKKRGQRLANVARQGGAKRRRVLERYPVVDEQKAVVVSVIAVIADAVSDIQQTAVRKGERHTWSEIAEE